MSTTTKQHEEWLESELEKMFGNQTSRCEACNTAAAALTPVPDPLCTCKPETV